ncbi:hypothetical protein [Natronococcus sp.]|uniref:hypothetical protein n=1 Tax=Natronococcus sp. TaxID=35747 RepID=UPI0025F1AFBE|nr:hypothetical protein [Natronococcus sp.]
MPTGLEFVDGDSLLVLVLVIAVALVHLLPNRLPVSSGRSRHGLLSAAGGVSIVYAFLHLFPELDGRRESLEGVDVLVGSLAGHHIYGLAFVGLALFYGLERLAAVSRSHEFERDLGPFADEPVFWIHVGGFAVYNAFIGYVLVRGETGAESATLFAVAMALHLFGNDAAMEQHHRDAYRRIGRWVLAAAVLLGAGVGAVYTFGDISLTILLGLLTGGVVFNAIKDELPRTQESRFWAFAAGAVGYGSILLLL